jgi:hypothetical protein
LAARRERREEPVPWVIGRDGKTYSVSDDAHLWRVAYGLSLLAIRKSPEEVADAMSVSVRPPVAQAVRPSDRGGATEGRRARRAASAELGPAHLAREGATRPDSQAKTLTGSGTCSALSTAMHNAMHASI